MTNFPDDFNVIDFIQELHSDATRKFLEFVEEEEEKLEMEYREEEPIKWTKEERAFLDDMIQQIQENKKYEPPTQS